MAKRRGTWLCWRAIVAVPLGSQRVIHLPDNEDGNEDLVPILILYTIHAFVLLLIQAFACPEE